MFFFCLYISSFSHLLAVFALFLIKNFPFSALAYLFLIVLINIIFLILFYSLPKTLILTPFLLCNTTVDVNPFSFNLLDVLYSNSFLRVQGYKLYKVQTVIERENKIVFVISNKSVKELETKMIVCGLGSDIFVA